MHDTKKDELNGRVRPPRRGHGTGISVCAALFLLGCGGGATSPGPTRSGSGSTPNGGNHQGHIAAAAVGSWTTSSVSDVNFTDGSGSVSDPSGKVVQFDFFEDGSYRFQDLWQTADYSCTNTLYGDATGTANFADDRNLTLTPTRAVLLSRSSCNVSWNYSQPWPGQDVPSQFTWSVGDDPQVAGRRILTLVRVPDGAQAVMHSK